MNEELHQAFLLILADLADPRRRHLGQTSNTQLLEITHLIDRAAEQCRYERIKRALAYQSDLYGRDISRPDIDPTA